nr:hypothetical protein [uncultured Niameybacter sp.]
MRKRKHTNGCLLRLLSFCASFSFLLLAGLFGLYYISEKPEIAASKADGQEVSSIQKATVDSTQENNLDQTREEIGESGRVNTPQNHSSNPIDENGLAKPYNNLRVDEDISDSSTGESGDEVKASDSEGSSGLEYEGDNIASTPASPEVIKDFEKVAVYDKYILSLDEDIVGTMGDMYNNGQVDYKSIVTKLFSKLSFSDQLRLLNIILSKAQNININEVWNMISDGITEEESVKLQELVQTHFTKEELDELYMYYQSSEIANNE